MIKIDVLAEIGDATKSIKKFSEESARNIDKMAKASTSSFAKLGNAVIVFNQGLELAGKAYRALTGVFKDGISAAIEQENAINDLNIALKGAGAFSIKASQDMQEFASSIQATTTFGDEAVLQAAALGMQLTKLSGDPLKNATKAALDMAAALNTDVDSAMRLIAKSAFDGGAILKRYGISVAEGKTESEKLANAISAVNKAFGGTAAGQIQTYQGALKQATNTYGEMLEEVGNLIIKNPILVKIINSSSKVFNQLGKYLIENRQAFIDFTKNGILKLVTGFEFLLDVLDIVTRTFKVFGNTVAGIFNFILSSVFGLVSKTSKALGSFASFFSGDLKKSFNEFGKAAEDLAIDKMGLVVEGFEDIEKAAKDENFTKLKVQTANFAKELENTSTKQIDITANQRNIASTSKETAEAQVQDLKKVNEELEKQRQAYIKLGADILGAFSSAVTQVQDINDNLNDSLVDSNQDLTENLAKIAEDAEKNLQDVNLSFSFDTEKLQRDAAESIQKLQSDTAAEAAKIESELNVKLSTLTNYNDIVNAYADAESSRQKLQIESQQKLADLQTSLTNENNELILKAEQDRQKIAADLELQRQATIDGAEKARQDLIDKAEADRLKASQKGAFDIIKSGAALAAEAYLPGLGQFVGPVLELLSAGGDAIKQTMKEIFKQIPQIIMALIDAVPDVIAALIEYAPAMASALLVKLTDPAFWVKFAGSLISSVAKAVMTLPATYMKTWMGLFKNLGTYLMQMFDIGKIVVDSVIKAFEGAGNFLSKLFKFDGGGKGAVENFLGFDFPWIAFAKGGVVPGGAKVQGDSKLNDVIPAMLSPGEIVLPRSIVNGGGNSIFDFLKSLGIELPGMAKGGVFGKAKGFLGNVVSSVTNVLGNVVDGILGTVVGGADLLIPGDLKGIYDSLKKMVKDINVGKFVANPIDETKRLVKGIADTFAPNFRQMMSFGLAEGGMIKSVTGGKAGFDSVPARLMPGELVVDRETTGKLQSFLNNGGDNDVTNALLAQIVQLLGKDQKVETEVKIDREIFANIILSLSRNNQRLTA